jgi:ABC-type spermidine/putrescine transport system permease subunit I
VAKIVSIGIPGTFFVAFFLGPLIYLILLGFWHVSNFQIVTDFSFTNYADIAHNLFAGSNYGYAIAQTLYVAATTAILAVLLCFTMALAILCYQSVTSDWSCFLAPSPSDESHPARYSWQVLLARKGVNSAFAHVGP